MKLIFSICLVIGVCFSGYSQQLKKIAALPDIIHESSGLVACSDTSVLTINDSGGEPVVYEVSLSGKLVSKTTFANVRNTDWEEITIDSGRVYIGDIGNNRNTRNNLTIYRFPLSKVGQRDVEADEIQFYYPEQMSYPPTDDEKVYDAEAFVIWENEIIIFTKCRTDPFTGEARIYKVPNEPGRHAARWVNTLTLGNGSWRSHSITGMCKLDKGIALLTYSDWYEIHLFNPDVKFWQNGNVIKHNLPFWRQREAITQMSDGRIIISDEKKTLLGGGNLYEWSGKKEK